MLVKSLCIILNILVVQSISLTGQELKRTNNDDLKNAEELERQYVELKHKYDFWKAFKCMDLLNYRRSSYVTDTVSKAPYHQLDSLHSIAVKMEHARLRLAELTKVLHGAIEIVGYIEAKEYDKCIVKGADDKYYFYNCKGKVGDRLKFKALTTGETAEYKSPFRYKKYISYKIEPIPSSINEEFLNLSAEIQSYGNLLMDCYFYSADIQIAIKLQLDEYAKNIVRWYYDVYKNAKQANGKYAYRYLEKAVYYSYELGDKVKCSEEESGMYEDYADEQVRNANYSEAVRGYSQALTAKKSDHLYIKLDSAICNYALSECKVILRKNMNGVCSSKESLIIILSSISQMIEKLDSTASTFKASESNHFKYLYREVISAQIHELYRPPYILDQLIFIPNGGCNIGRWVEVKSMYLYQMSSAERRLLENVLYRTGAVKNKAELMKLIGLTPLFEDEYQYVKCDSWSDLNYLKMDGVTNVYGVYLEQYELYKYKLEDYLDKDDILRINSNASNKYAARKKSNIERQERSLGNVFSTRSNIKIYGLHDYTYLLWKTDRSSDKYAFESIYMYGGVIEFGINGSSGLLYTSESAEIMDRILYGVRVGVYRAYDIVIDSSYGFPSGTILQANEGSSMLKIGLELFYSQIIDAAVGVAYINNVNIYRINDLLVNERYSGWAISGKLGIQLAYITLNVGTIWPMPGLHKYEFMRNYSFQFGIGIDLLSSKNY